MNRSIWKWIFGISLIALVLLLMLTFGIWVLLNIGGAILLALMGNQEITAMPMGKFLSNFIGSPMFYIYLADLVVLLSSTVALIVTRQK